MSSNPSVTVLMSVYNGATYLREAIKSILSQSYKDFEFIIIDDGSTDDSLKIIESFAQSDNRIYFESHENCGLPTSLNKGLRLAKGTYIARQDADDISLPYRLQKQIEFFHNHTDAVLVFGGLQFIDKNGRVEGTLTPGIADELIPWHLLFTNCVLGHGQVMFRKEAVLALGGYDVQYKYGQDYELWSRLVRQYTIHSIPDILFQYRRHENNISNAHYGIQQAFGVTVVSQNLSWLLEVPTFAHNLAQALSAFWNRQHRKAVSSVDIRVLQLNLRYIAIAFGRKFPAHNKYSIGLGIGLELSNRFWQLSRHLGWRSQMGRAALKLCLFWSLLAISGIIFR